MKKENKIHESMVYITNKQKPMRYLQNVAVFDCGPMMPEGFEKIFQNDIDGIMYRIEDGLMIHEEEYTEKPKCADFPTVISWLEKEVEKDDYRRLKPFLSLLKGFDLSQWGNMKVVHIIKG